MKTSKNGLFLLEMILVVFFFAVTSGICLQMFGFAAKTAENARDLSRATLLARSVADCYQSTKGDLPRMATILDATVTTQGLTGQYPGEKDDKQDDYGMTMTSKGGLAQITVTKAERVIYRLYARIPGGDGQ